DPRFGTPSTGVLSLLMRGKTQTDPPVPHYSTKPDSISNQKIPVSVKLLAKCDTFAPTQAFLLIRLPKLAFLLNFAALSRPAHVSNSTSPADQSGRNPMLCLDEGFLDLSGKGSRRIVVHPRSLDGRPPRALSHRQRTDMGMSTGCHVRGLTR